MRVLLVTRREKAEQRNPIALLDLAAYLRGFGHHVDCHYLDRLPRGGGNGRSYDVVGLSVLQVLRERVPLRDALYLKKVYGAHTVVGGKWTQTLTEGQRVRFQNEGIEVYAGRGETYFREGGIHFDSYPSWERRDFETLQDLRADVMSTRGCPYHCHFCHNTEKGLTFFPARRTADNIELLFDLGVRRVSFSDDIFTLKASHMAGLYEEMKRRNLPFEGRTEFFTHINHLQGEILDWIKKFEPYQVNVGVESGDDRMLRAMGKGFDTRTAYERIKGLREVAGVRVGTLFLIGFPGETEGSLQNTLNFIGRLRPFAGAWVSYYQPVPGTKGYQMARKRKKGFKPGSRNMSIAYVDPNLSSRTLFKYNYRMMDFSSSGGLRKRLVYRFMDYAPSFILEKWRMARQRKRLRRHMESYLDGGIG